jgi:hypothetical protein
MGHGCCEKTIDVSKWKARRVKIGGQHTMIPKCDCVHQFHTHLTSSSTLVHVVRQEQPKSRVYGGVVLSCKYPNYIYKVHAIYKRHRFHGCRINLCSLDPAPILKSATCLWLNCKISAFSILPAW